MKVLTIAGTRPEIIRLSRIIPILDQNCQHVLMHTGQNYIKSLNQIFFEQLSIREPNYIFACKAETLMGQISQILINVEKVILIEQPDRILLLGDTNSALAAIVAKRMRIPVFHMEAGNRCYDDNVPEEVNRRLIDHCSDTLLPYTERSRANLIKEGIASNRIFVTGNPITEVLQYYEYQIRKSSILEQLKITPKNYFLVTLHRAENVDDTNRLENFFEAFISLKQKYDIPIIFSVHPRTRSQMEKNQSITNWDGLTSLEPMGLFDFVQLEKNAACILSDSGTVQEECCILKVPSITLRDVTERPETIETGSNLLTGSTPNDILRSVELVINKACEWTPPSEYVKQNVSQTVAKIVLGK
ncbi:UDP-2,3-diacetamido-2,3-dideoxy-D-glucuronate 2-epimerase [Sporomusa ovata DSM 2662]|uniref:UDP-N-acetylglucosamine 2-epimerase n=1 Tax=Sporomusa ovata TaxID=2378 RepID=A0A0U1KV22_9FIRM|nr:UDP-N-acetylglucosamine 2-epimerase (non-hydrolyzing) [Sporomusa ovata]EQB27119.1 UDP-N-acetylglucosamine 2-epimerase [Sporomusa ovata DSM 2662]CQR71221.1 UDP-N-acetylglucosamine 2-epimerase [Sporomusa ovata]